MSDYFTGFNDKLIHAYNLDNCLNTIKCRNERNEERIRCLEKENKNLKEKYSKDEEIQKMQQRLDKMQKNYYRGFPINENEEKEIENWKKEHAEKAHGLKTDDDRMRSGGCIGGNYKYEFIPTSIGVSGKIICSCGAEFEFQKIE